MWSYDRFMRSILLLLICSVIPMAAEEQVQDGFWEVDAQKHPVKAVQVPVQDVRVVSENNANSSFYLSCDYQKDGYLDATHYVLRIGPDIAVPSGSGGNATTQSLSIPHIPAALAERIGAFFKVSIHKHAHPGYRLDAVIVPHRETMVVGGTLTVDFVIRNVGDRPFYFQWGGSQRGPRDNQFTVSVEGPHGLLKIKDANDFGGLSVIEEIKPAGECTLTIPLQSWFDANTPGEYGLSLSYDMSIRDSASYERLPVWSDALTRRCYLTVSEPVKP